MAHMPCYQRLIVIETRRPVESIECMSLMQDMHSITTISLELISNCKNNINFASYYNLNNNILNQFWMREASPSLHNI